jgi:hypothetical protein
MMVEWSETCRQNPEPHLAAEMNRYRRAEEGPDDKKLWRE